MSAWWETRTSRSIAGAADIRNILDFERDYPKAKVIRLSKLPLHQEHPGGGRQGGG
jgi:hypothetical protein